MISGIQKIQRSIPGKRKKKVDTTMEETNTSNNKGSSNNSLIGLRIISILSVLSGISMLAYAIQFMFLITTDMKLIFPLSLVSGLIFTVAGVVLWTPRTWSLWVNRILYALVLLSSIIYFLYGLGAALHPFGLIVLAALLPQIGIAGVAVFFLFKQICDFWNCRPPQ